MDPMERADAERAVYYAKFDRAVATLSPEQAERVDLLSSFLDNDGTWHLRAQGGHPVATLRDPDLPAPALSGEPAPTPAHTAAFKGPTATQRKLLLACAQRIVDVEDTLSKALMHAFNRIKALETQAALDAELIKEFENIAGRVDAIETRGFRFLGKYQAPATYKLGDVVAYKDALWHCVQDCKVGDRPNTASHKWVLMIAGIQE
jgi:hypothetical protein